MTTTMMPKITFIASLQWVKEVWDPRTSGQDAGAQLERDIPHYHLNQRSELVTCLFKSEKEPLDHAKLCENTRLSTAGCHFKSHLDVSADSNLFLSQVLC